MTAETRVRKWRWLRHVAWVVGINAFLAAAFFVIFFGSGLGNPLLKRLLVSGIQKRTGGRVELRTLSIRWLSLRATLKGLVIHGSEPNGTEPFLAVDEIQAGLRIDSFWGRKVSLNDLSVKGPQIHVRVEKDGRSNIPVAAHTGPAGKPLRETLFDLHVRKAQIVDGWILYNNVKAPLALEGDDLQCTVDSGGTREHPLYLGKLDWETVRFTARRYWPIPANLSVKFSAWREGLALEQVTLGFGHSHLDATAEMSGFVVPQWSFRYRGWIDLADIRDNLREPMAPSGRVDLRGEGKLAAGQVQVNGSYAGQEIRLIFQDFHAGGLSSRGSYKIDNAGLEVPDFFAAAASGRVTGRVTLRFAGVQFRAATHLQDIRLAELLPEIDHHGFPVDALHWDGLLSGDTIETWSGPFRHFEIAGQMHWAPPDQVAAGHQPVEADWKIRYRYDPNIFDIIAGEFATPTSRGTITGVLADRGTGLDFHFETGALETYKDFINAIAGTPSGSADAMKRIAGNVRWDGKIADIHQETTFQGHLRGERVNYEGVAFDYLEGDVSWSPSELSIANGRVRSGGMETQIDGGMELTHWSFLPENAWSAEANFEKVPVDDLQKLLGWKYPVRGVLTGQLHGRGTRAQPTVSGLFDLANGDAYGLAFNRLRGQINLTPDEVRIADAELRFFPLGKGTAGAGIITGSAGYRFADGSITTNLVGASLPLENFGELRMARLPLAGQLSFRVKANGPAKAPMGEGTFRVVDLRVGQEVIGSFDGSLSSDGKTAKLQLGSAMTTGAISGGYTLGLADPYPISGTVSIKNINLDPFLMTALHLHNFSGYGVADGDIAVTGELKNADKIVVDARFSRLVLDYANVRLENSGPVHFRSSKNDLQIDPVTFKGTDTNLQLQGALQFAGKRTVNMRLNGGVDLRLLSGFVPDLDAHGPAQINAAIEGTFERPRITGRVHIENAAVRAGNFPTGLSAITGDMVFDATRLFFEDITAQAGGGTLRFSGSVSYADSPMRFDITTRTDGVRVRYPEGMSWQVAGSLRLTGTPSSGVLSGRVSVQRVTMSGGLETAGLLVSAKEGASGPATSSGFLRNLQFDVEAVSSPDARMEWPGATLEAEANLRVRGTWDHPILLGHIHVLSGDLSFHGNRYRVTRGDVNFANPFRLDPVVNVEATTIIQQYEITLNFSGPSSKLTLAYRSDPPLPGNDIITLLALGQTSSEAAARSGAGAQGAGTGASAILSEAVSSQLGGKLERLFGITRFRVDPGLTEVGSTSGQNASARVTVEQQVARDLTITYVSNVSSTQEQVIQVEYNLSRNVSIVALRDQNGTFGIDVKIKKRFP